MKNNFMRTLPALLAAALCSGSLISCGDTAASVSPEVTLPEDIIHALEYRPPETKSYGINFYFNNSTNTRGFFSPKLLASASGTYERGVFDYEDPINTHSFMQALENSFASCSDLTTYVIEESYTTADLSWQELDPNKNVFSLTRNATFFLNRSMNDSLSHNNLLDFGTGTSGGDTTLNLYLTSLDELNYCMSDLTRWIRSQISEDTSACLVGMLCDYNGALPLRLESDDSSESAGSKELAGKRVLYLLASGPEEPMNRYIAELESSLRSCSLVYDLCRFPNAAITPVDTIDEIRIAPEFTATDSISREELAEQLENGSFSYTMNLEPVEMTEYSDMFTNVNDYVNMIVYRFEDQGLTKNRMIANIYLPLYECSDQTVQDYSCRVSQYFQGTGDAALDQLLGAKDYMTVRLLGTQTAEDGTQVSGYTDLSHYDFTKAGFGVTSRILSAAEVPADDASAPLSSEAEYWLQVRLEYRYDPSFRNRSSLLLTLPVYAVRSNSIPQWVENCSCSPNDRKLSSPDMLFRTSSLYEFTSSLAGLNADSSGRNGRVSLNTAMFESKLCDLVLYIDGIPTA